MLAERRPFLPAIYNSNLAVLFSVTVVSGCLLLASYFVPIIAIVLVLAFHYYVVAGFVTLESVANEGASCVLGLVLGLPYTYRFASCLVDFLGTLKGVCVVISWCRGRIEETRK